jgi:CHAT domain-containing protein
MQQFPSYKIIQLYTHAADSSSQGEPVIYFSDSSLYLSELIPEGRTAAQLIVLSACETGNGNYIKVKGSSVLTGGCDGHPHRLPTLVGRE